MSGGKRVRGIGDPITLGLKGSPSQRSKGVHELGFLTGPRRSHRPMFAVKRFLALAALSAAAALPLALAQDETVRRYDANAQMQIEFSIKKTKDPIFPVRLRSEGYLEGHATFAIYVDQNGVLRDFLVLEATRLEFAREVEKVLPQWEFSVPYVDGEKASLASMVKVSFERTGVIVYESAGLITPWAFRQKDVAYRIYGLWELDKVPVPIDLVKPDFHTELLEDRDVVNAVFEFYIDEKGHVRIPTLREADDKVDERLLVIAQDTLLQWRFDPPKVNGKPVVARAAQPFRFTKRAATAAVSE